ncbi:MAG: FAD-binding oxidoreductase, partial [Myxococcota bacterium]|nr:FAD-binding oxidoreductase [Myxococcota bacterium]
GGDAERALAPHGLTLGHWPQSIELSTVGGWVATRASGQYSTAYGNIEDLVLALEVVLPDGSILRTRETPRAAAGPDLRQIFLGSEGTLGVVTQVTFSAHARLPAMRGQAFHFDGFRAGLEPIRRALRGGFAMPVARLYDAREARRNFRDFVPRDRSLLLLLHEGGEAAVEAEVAAVATLCREGGGVPADAAVVDQWLARRNHVPSFRSFLEQGVVVDTIEVAATWSRVGALYDGVVGALSRVPGVLAATAHSSHSYRSGTCLYFSFAAKPEDPARLRATYAACWRAAMEATLAAGGGIAHHHGIGRVRRPWLAAEIGDTGVALLRALKHALDPDALLNPGNLIP